MDTVPQLRDALGLDKTEWKISGDGTRYRVTSHARFNLEGALDEMVRAAIESKAADDEGTFLPLGDLIDFSGENKTRTVVRLAIRAALLAAESGGR